MTEDEMTDDASPENLRKFLESDDPAMVLMGLSMAKGSGVPEELLPTILGLMWDDDKSVRGAAKSVFNKYAPAELQAKVKENWKPSYRTLSVTGDKFPGAIRQFLEAFKSQDDFAEIVWRRAEPLTEALMDRNRKVRLDATEALGKIGNERAVEPLVKALGDNDVDVRWFATEALGKIGDARAVEPLIKVLEDAKGRVRSSATEALGEIGDERAVEPLIKALSNDDKWVRKSAAGALDKLGWAPETDGQRAAYLIAVEDWESLVEWGEPAVEPLIKALGDDDNVCRAAVKALGEIGEPAVESLIKTLGDDANTVRMHAANVLGNIGDERAVEPLIEPLRDEDCDVRESAAEALGMIGDARAVEPLIGVLSDENVSVRVDATKALGKIGDERAVEPLIGMLSDDNQWVRWGAVEALGEIGDERAVEPLIRMLSDDDRAYAAGALDKLGWVPETDGQRAAYLIAGKDWESLVEWGGPAVEPLIVLLGDDYNVCRTAVKTLGEIGEPAVEPLIEVLSGDDLGVRRYAAEALGEIGDGEAVEPLIKALGDEDVYVRQSASTALGKIGDERAVEPLIKALGDEDGYVREYAAGALDKLGWVPETDGQRAAYLISKNWKSLVEWGEPAVEPLIKALGDGGAYVRETAVKALGEIGDERAVEPLIGILLDENLNLRMVAAEELRKFGLQGLQGFITAGQGEELTVPELKTILEEKKLPTSGTKPLLIQRIMDAYPTNYGSKMTDDASPEDLRKFLESDDPATLMGALVDGSGVPEELLPTILGLYMWDDDKGVRATAKKLFFKNAPKELQAKVKENWQVSYRTLSVGTLSEVIRPFLEAFKSQDAFSEIALKPLIEALGQHGTARGRWGFSMAKGEVAAEALGELGDARAVEPLIRVLGSNPAAARALGEIGDERAVEPLITALENEYVRDAAKEALRKLGHEVE